MRFNLGRCVGYKTKDFVWKAYVLDMDRAKNAYLIEYQDYTGKYKQWVHKDYLIEWKNK